MDGIYLEKSTIMFSAGTTTPYFKLEKQARQGYPISAYLFILALEILFYMIKTNQDLERLDICGCSFLYSAYADDTTFFLKDVKYGVISGPNTGKYGPDMTPYSVHFSYNKRTSE